MNVTKSSIDNSGVLIDGLARSSPALLHLASMCNLFPCRSDLMNKR